MSGPLFKSIDHCTELERETIRKLRTDSGFWNGDPKAIQTLREFERKVRGDTQQAVADFKSHLETELAKSREEMRRGFEKIVSDLSASKT